MAADHSQKRRGPHANFSVKLEADHLVSRGREALQRIKAHHAYRRRLFGDWMLVGEAIMAGRAVCIEDSGADPAKGSRLGSAFNRTFGGWLIENHFTKDDGLHESTRSYLINIMEQREAVERWRNGLPEAQQLAWNEPQTVWEHFQESLQPPEPEPEGTDGHADKPDEAVNFASIPVTEVDSDDEPPVAYTSAPAQSSGTTERGVHHSSSAAQTAKYLRRLVIENAERDLESWQKRYGEIAEVCPAYRALRQQVAARRQELMAEDNGDRPNARNHDVEPGRANVIAEEAANLLRRELGDDKCFELLATFGASDGEDDWWWLIGRALEDRLSRRKVAEATEPAER